MDQKKIAKSQTTNFHKDKEVLRRKYILLNAHIKKEQNLKYSKPLPQELGKKNIKKEKINEAKDDSLKRSIKLTNR